MKNSINRTDFISTLEYIEIFSELTEWLLVKFLGFEKFYYIFREILD